MERTSAPKRRASPAAARRGGRGREEANAISRDGSAWSTVSLAERNAFLLEMARAGASLRELRVRVRPPLTPWAISKVLLAGGFSPRPRGNSAEPIAFVSTGIGPIDELRRVASSIPGLTVGELARTTTLSDWTIRELLVHPVDAKAIERGALRHAQAIDRIAQVRESVVILTRPRAADLSRLLGRLSSSVFASYRDNHTWASLEAATGVPPRVLRRLVGEKADGAIAAPLDRIAEALGYGWDLSYQIAGHSLTAATRGRP